jgi:PilZ domain
VAAARPGPLYSRRLIPRVEVPEALWVCWRCAGVEDVSPVRDLSVGGLFLTTASPRPLGARAKVDFLVPEGQIRAEAIVQHQVPNSGLGLKFTAITDQDCPRLVALMDRICSQPTSKLPVRNPHVSS